eukprot:superscaffoldBa00000097_g1429
MEPFSSRHRASDQLGSRRSTRIHAMAHSDAALFQAINIFNRMFAHLRNHRGMTKQKAHRDMSPSLSLEPWTLLPLVIPFGPWSSPCP